MNDANNNSCIKSWKEPLLRAGVYDEARWGEVIALEMGGVGSRSFIVRFS